ncbi:MAG: aromatic ring-hydroxylating dioxygenase subunit alpha [Bdellovibrionales bacterium]|nr:aromatic ring-hydroxylating dioxygenase subunit alpha [Bdellovibrionales bacterium]
MKSLKEADGQLRENWYILALEEELKDKPIRREVYDKAYVIFRDENGRMQAFEDRCIHRGAQLSLGHTKKGCLQCPYHGWTFDGLGQLKEVPSQGDKLGKAQSQWRLNRPVQSVQDGCLWIWCGDEAPSDRWPSWRFPFADDKKWHKYFMITDFDNDVTHLIQNFMDVPHTVFVHKHWFRRQEHLKVPITLEVHEGRVKVTYHQKNDSIGFFSRMLNPKKEPMIHTDEFIYPNITRVDYKFGEQGFVINSQCTPIGRYKTRVYTWIAYKMGGVGPWIKPLLGWYTRAVIEQDVEIMANQGDNFRFLEERGESLQFVPKNGYYSTSADELHLAIDEIRAKGVSDPQEARAASYQREREFWI